MGAAKHLVVSIAGVIGFAVTVAGIVLFEHYTGFNLFTFSFFVVVPVGAIAAGIAAASGFYLASIWLQVRPNWLLLVQMVAAAAVAQIAIYYAEYRAYALPDGTMAASLVNFREFVDVYLSSQHIRIGRTAIDGGEMGQAGWWLAALDYLGFLAGGVLTYLLLRAHPSCRSCSLYLRKLGTKQQVFEGQDDFALYYDGLFSDGVGVDRFHNLLTWSPHQGKNSDGNILTTTTLRSCPRCREEILSEEVKVLAKNGWQDVPKLTRHTLMPEGYSVLPFFKMKPSPLT